MERGAGNNDTSEFALGLGQEVVAPPPHLETFGMSRAREILSDDVGGVVLDQTYDLKLE